MITVFPEPKFPDAFRGSRGVSLLEVAIGIVLLAFLGSAATMMTRTQIKSNTLGDELADVSNVLRAFIDVLRTLERSSGYFEPDRERAVDFQGYRVTMIFYDESSGGAYRQFPGMVLACVKAEYQANGVKHKLETSTMLRPR